MSVQPIGLFDSGVGGFSIMREIRRNLPYENMVFLSDNARHPYGSKSELKIRTISLGNALFLSRKESKIVVVACNTASAVAKEFIESMIDTQVIGVIDAGVRAALESSKNGRIGVIGTRQTIASGAHEKALTHLNPDVKVFSKATPIFAPVVEEGYLERSSTDLLIREEMEFFINNGVDTLILGCTHYPFLVEKIAASLGPMVKLIDPAKETAKEIKAILSSTNKLNRSGRHPWTHVFSSDPSGMSYMPSGFPGDMAFSTIGLEDLEKDAYPTRDAAPEIKEVLLS